MNNIERKTPSCNKLNISCIHLFNYNIFFSVAFLCSSDPDVSNQMEENNEGTNGGITTSLRYSFF